MKSTLSRPITQRDKFCTHFGEIPGHTDRSPYLHRYHGKNSQHKGKPNC